MLTSENIKFIHRISNNWLIRNFIFSSEICDFIGCQFALESNFGCSNLAKSSFNYCGMKLSLRRVSYRLPGLDDNGFAVYNSLDSCVLDYISWLLFNRPNQINLESLDSFKLFLRDSGYCPEKDYISKIQLIYQQFKNFKNE